MLRTLEALGSDPLETPRRRHPMDLQLLCGAWYRTGEPMADVARARAAGGARRAQAPRTGESRLSAARWVRTFARVPMSTRTIIRRHRHPGRSGGRVRPWIALGAAPRTGRRRSRGNTRTRTSNAASSSTATQRSPFSVKYFLIAILFVLVRCGGDLYPWAVNFKELGVCWVAEMVSSSPSCSPGSSTSSRKAR